MKEGDWVKIIKQSTRYNIHIYNVGYVGKIDELGEDVAQIKCSDGGFGAVDLECLAPYVPSLRDKANYRSWHPCG